MNGAKTSPDGRPLVEALSDPRFYPHRPERVERRQTHISWVFLAGDVVYKLKKPVRFAFVDYSTLERRREFCRAEVELNRRLAPSVYRGIAAVVSRGRERILCEGDPVTGEVEDYLVVMRRLRDEDMLDRRLAAGTAGTDVLERIAAKLAEFHARCSDRGDRYGRPAAIAEATRGNLDECRRFADDTVSGERLAALDRYVRAFLSEQADLLGKRVRKGRIREGHGDLRAEHVCLDRGLEIVDCVEFSEQLRSSDVASEIAFLSMDLDFLGLPVLSEEFARAYAERADDPDLLLLLPFYECYRAVVRGKVETLRSREPEVDRQAREAARRAAQRYFRLAERYTRARRAPEIIVVYGLSGTGKSTVARIVCDLTGFAAVNSDVVRKDLAGVPRLARPDVALSRRLYSGPMSRRTYDELNRRARAALAAGRGAVLDATYLDAAHRREIAALGAARGVPVLFVECRAEEPEVRRRLRERQGRADEVSDASEDVYLRQRSRQARLGGGTSGRYVAIDTGRDVEEISRDVERLLGIV